MISVIILLCITAANAQTCGVPQAKPVASSPTLQQRIVGGREARPHSWPWTVFLTYGDTFFCGGTLIKSDLVVTAAHCLYGVDMSNVIVNLGAHNSDTFSPYDSYLVKRKVKNYTIHAGYDDDNLSNDIALVQLNQTVTYNFAIQPICLPATNQLPYNSSNCYAVGWGWTSEYSYNPSYVLMQVRVPQLPSSGCPYDGYNNVTQLCAGYPQGSKDACQGDSGGPWACLNSNAISWTLFGIVSYGIGCARAGYGGVYTNVNQFINWINTIPVG